MNHLPMPWMTSGKEVMKPISKHNHFVFTATIWI